ncbi:MAG: DUF1549 domain-containing protein [Gemmataceae bacterium]
MMSAVLQCSWLTYSLVAACVLLLSGQGDAAVTLPGGVKVKDVDFERHVMGLFGRMGCNAGSCHGSFQGKGGLRLSLFGYDPSIDHAAVTRDVHGRRLNPVDPDKSLLLLKATGQVPHGGGTRFGRESWQAKLLREWIASGAKWDKGKGDVERIQIDPPEHAFRKAGESIQLGVIAIFTDGSKLNVAPLCDFRTNDDAVAEVDGLGIVRALRPGSTSIVVSYRGNVLPVQVMVPMTLPKGYRYPDTPKQNYVDQHVFSRLRKMNIAPSELSSDTEFLRRVYLDTVGRLPEPEEIRSFLRDSNKNKRSKLIDKLLAHPDHASLWATRYCDITGNDTLSLENPQNLRSKRSQMWHEWFKKRFHENMPYDEIVKGVLTATSREGKSVKQWVNDEYDSLKKAMGGWDFSGYANRKSLDLFWRRRQRVPVEQWAEKTAAAFMGVRLECAQCHKHPFDRWSQEEYRSYANVFTQVAYGISREARNEANALNKRLSKGKKKKNQIPQIKEVYLNDRPIRPLSHPQTGKQLPPQALGGPVIEVDNGTDPRVALFQWLRKRDNPFFARSFVNRVWGHYLGKGIVDPVDDFSLANPPSNAPLLNALAEDFAKHNYDIRYIERIILNSRTYQLSSKTNETNKLDNNNFSHAYTRPMLAEVSLDIINQALGAKENFGKDVRPGSRAIEVGPSFVQSATTAYAFRVLGRPPRTTACDCERAADPALPQKLFTMTDTGILAKIKRSPRVANVLRSKKSDAELFEELVLATLSRFPTDRERQAFASHRRKVTDRREAFQDMLWVLINTREFILNH